MDFFIDPGGKMEMGETAEAANRAGKTVHMQAFMIKNGPASLQRVPKSKNCAA